MADQSPSETEQPKGEIPSLGESIIVRWLIGLNLIVHALNALIPATVTTPGGEEKTVGLLQLFGNFNVVDGINGFEFWRLFTYQFLHGGYLHLGMNMMALYVFGPMVEKWWGAKRFVAFYLLCGACGAWLMAVFAFNPGFLNAGQQWLVGASGSIFGVLVASAMLFPRDQVKLMLPPIWVSVRTLAIVFILLSFGSMFLGYNPGGNAAHLGGAIFGWLLVRRPWSLDFVDPGAPKLDPPGKDGVDESADPVVGKDSAGGSGSPPAGGGGGA